MKYKCDVCDIELIIGDDVLPPKWSSLIRKFNNGEDVEITDITLCGNCGPVIEIRCDCGLSKTEGYCCGPCDNDD